MVDGTLSPWALKDLRLQASGIVGQGVVFRLRERLLTSDTSVHREWLPDLPAFPSLDKNPYELWPKLITVDLRDLSVSELRGSLGADLEQVLDETVALIDSRAGRAVMQLGVAEAMDEELGRVASNPVLREPDAVRAIVDRAVRRGDWDVEQSPPRWSSRC